MNRKGFTLIELLAVIVILAIIALIAVPIVLNIIDSSKESSDERSVELYGSAVENALGEYQVEHPEDTEITKEKIKDYIKYKGNKVECEIVINNDGTVYLDNCKVDGKDVSYTYGKKIAIGKAATKDNKTLAGTVPQGNFELGDEYIVNVDGEHEYHFYVLSTEGDKVNLIMSNNICSDGTLATETNTCLVAWITKIDYNDNANYGSNGNTRKGPITAMNYLYEATKNWKNIKDIQIDYTDEGNTETAGYGTIKTSGDKTIITMKGGTETATYENLKARMPKKTEITGTGCSGTPGKCPAWMVNGLLLDSRFYPPGTKEDISNIGGYWSLSSYGDSNSIRVYSVNSWGNVDGLNVGSYNGLRPVITVLKSYLS